VLLVETVGTGDPVMLVHGFTQTHRSWQPVVDRLAGQFRLSLVDAPGHGTSAEVHTDLVSGARLLGEAGGHGSYVGYSMGARLCLHLALQQPELVTRLVVIGGHPGIADAGERATRLAGDVALAGRLEAQGVPAFVDWWLAQPLFSTLSTGVAQRDDRLTNTAAGLASSLRLAGTGSQEPLWDRLGQLTMPVLVMAGELDRRFVDLGRRTVAAIGTNAELVLIPGAGHACHLERPDACCLVLADFLGDELG